MTNCKCGKTATHIAYFPSDNIWAGLRQTTMPVHVCDYHAIKAMRAGYDVEIL